MLGVHHGPDGAAAAETVAAIEEAGGTAFGVRALLGTPGDAEGAVVRVRRQTGSRRRAERGVDILVNNAAIVTLESPAKVTADEFEWVLAVNVRAPTASRRSSRTL